MSDKNSLPYHKRTIQPKAQEKVAAKVGASTGWFKDLKLPFTPKGKKKRRGLIGKANPFTLENLHEHLRIAMMLELSTIPPYLCALYSIQTGDRTQPGYQENFGDNAEVANIIRSVMMEEMLHFTLVGNILNAVGGKFMITDKQYVPTYPTTLPHSNGDFEVSLRKFDKTAIRAFMRIEEPTPSNVPPRIEGYATIGQFYNGIILLIKTLGKSQNIFTGDESRQIDEKYYYGGGDEQIIKVTDEVSALKAIEIIMEQGEGTEDNIREVEVGDEEEIRELAHYYKYLEIYEEQRYADCQKNPKEPPQGTKMDIKYDRVYNMMINPKTEDFVTDELKNLSREFNLLYMGLLHDLQAAFTGEPDRLIKGVGKMFKLRYKAVELMRNPIPGRKVNAGPTFEYVEEDVQRTNKIT